MNRHFASLRSLAAAAAVTLLAGAGLGGCPDDDTTPTCTAGSEGCECAAGGECESGLTCGADDLCVAESCTPGTTGCTCAAGDTCTDSSDECLSDNTCGPRTSCQGELGCACDGGSCDAGLTCSADLCTQSNAVLVSLDGGDARACDLLIETTGRKVSEVSFPAGYRGKMRTRDGKTAISLIRTQDTAVTGVAVAVIFDGDDAVADGEASVVRATCYDRLGTADSGVTASIQ